MLPGFCYSTMQLASQIPHRTAVIALLFVLSSLLSSARLILETPNPYRLKPDVIGLRSDQRFATLKRALPERGTIGYMGDSGEFAVVDYYLTQYALAPVVVDHSLNHRLIVGNYRSAAHPESFPRNFELIKDFGEGVLLFSNKDAR
jgi:hypothetical protein